MQAPTFDQNDSDVPSEDYARHRNLKGYGEKRPHARWPDNARIAIQFVLNFEEGGENNVLHGDGAAETFLADMVPAPEIVGMRHATVESVYEYGTRAGVWRILRLFEERGWPLTIFAVASALERYPEMARRFIDAGHEVAAHGYRWVDHQYMEAADELEQMRKAIASIEHLTAQPVRGWYTGRSSPDTLRLTSQLEGVAYSADDYSDDLPFWDSRYERPLLIVPYALDTNDMRFSAAHGFADGEAFFQYLKDAFDVLYEEGADRPAMMSVGLHGRLAGRPGRFAGLKRFADYISGHRDVWVCRRIDIAEHWRTHHPLEGAAA